MITIFVLLSVLLKHRDAALIHRHISGISSNQGCSGCFGDGSYTLLYNFMQKNSKAPLGMSKSL